MFPDHIFRTKCIINSLIFYLVFSILILISFHEHFAHPIFSKYLAKIAPVILLLNGYGVLSGLVMSYIIKTKSTKNCYIGIAISLLILITVLFIWSLIPM